VARPPVSGAAAEQKGRAAVRREGPALLLARRGRLRGWLRVTSGGFDARLTAAFQLREPGAEEQVRPSSQQKEGGTEECVSSGC